MATGFILRHSRWLLAALWALPALASEVSFVGPIGDKAAVLVIGNGPPKTVKVGQTFGGVTVISVEKERATVEVEGKRRVLVRGQTWSTSPSGSDRQSVTLAAGAGGHYFTEGLVNGGSIRFIVDTGATVIALPAADASRLGIDYRKGRRGVTHTAAGQVEAFLVKLDTVRVGGIELQNVDAIVIERGLNVALLGMSFLNRVEMRRDGDRMTLIRRY
ncbi:MAG: TIGR02281 family clan AA aspartic protease [Pseudomonadota bacterium]